MNINESIRERHSVRQYIDEPLEADIASKLKEKIILRNEGKRPLYSACH